MKFLFFLLPFTIAAQQTATLQEDESGSLYYQTVMETGMPKEQNYQRVKEALVYMYENTNVVLQYDTPEKIIVKGSFYIPYLIIQVLVDHTMTIDIKDDKIRVTFSQLLAQYQPTHEKKYLNSKPSFMYPAGYWKKINKGTLEYLQSINKFLISKIKSTNTEEEW